jgi:hypothetical protein
VHRRLHVHLGTIGFDHHQAGILEELLGIDAGLLGARLVCTFDTRLLDRGRRGLLIARLLLLRLFVPMRLFLPLRFLMPLRLLLLTRLLVVRLFCARLELVDAPLLLGQSGGCRRMVLARAIDAITAVAAIAVAAAAVTASPAVLLAFALGTRTLPLTLGLALNLRLAVGRELMKLGRFT